MIATNQVQLTIAPNQRLSWVPAEPIARRRAWALRKIDYMLVSHYRKPDQANESSWVAQILAYYVDCPLSHPYVRGRTVYGVPRGIEGDGTFTIYQTVSCPAGEQNHASSGT